MATTLFQSSSFRRRGVDAPFLSIQSKTSPSTWTRFCALITFPMNSSPAPPVDDGLTFYAAARLHARRFDRSVLSSMFLLNACDQLLTDTAGGVLALTDLGRSKWRARLLAVTFVGGLAVVLWAGFRGLLGLGVALAAVLLILLVVVAPK